MNIISPDNSKIKEYRKLSMQKKYRDETGLFVLEGARLVRDALDSGISPELLFCTESAAEAFFSASPHIITAEIAGKISAAKSPQGVFAVCKKPERPLSFSGRAVVLAGLSDPGNIGTIIRTADAMGIPDIISIDSADIFSPKTTRAAMGSLFHVNILETDRETAFGLLSKHDFTAYAAVVDSTAEAVGTFEFDEKSAVIIGNEANGISEEILIRADRRITINMPGNANSLNAAAAASILIWELRRKT